MEHLAARSNQIQPNGSFPVEIDGRKILLVRTEEKLFAVENSCPHQGKTLERAVPDGTLLRCIFHGVTIDLADGNIVNAAGYLGLGPAVVFAVVERDGNVFIDLEKPTPA